MKKIIYQFCLNNHMNHFDMLNRITYLIDSYKTEIMPISEVMHKIDIFKDKDEMIFLDIIPFFLEPRILVFSFDDYQTEREMEKEITQKVLEFVENIVDPELTLVIKIEHNIPLTNEI